MENPGGEIYMQLQILVFLGREERGRGRKNRHRLDNTPCNSLADAVKLITFESLEVGRRVA